MTARPVLNRLLILAAIGGLLPLGAAYWWPFELLSHFRIQYVVLAVVLAILAFAGRRRHAGAALVIAAAINAWPLLPYLPRSAPAEPAQAFTVLNVNVNADNAAHTRIVDAILAAGPDLVAVIELSPELDQALLALADEYPHRLTAPGFGNFGIGVVSRYPFASAGSIALGDTAAIDSTVELPAGSVRFLAVHLVPPVGSVLAAERNRQLDELARYTSDVEEPLLVCGDFNLTPYSPFFARFTRAASLRDTRLGSGFGISWPTFMPLLGIPIDHCLIRGPLQADSVARLERIGSDHYPVQLSLSWLDER